MLLPQVMCPDDLYDALVTTWNEHPQYADLCEIVLDGDGSTSDDDAVEGDEPDQDSTLMDTFYRCTQSTWKRIHLTLFYSEETPA